MLVMSILRMVGAGEPRMSFGTGSWSIFFELEPAALQLGGVECVRGRTAMESNRRVS